MESKPVFAHFELLVTMQVRNEKEKTKEEAPCVLILALTRLSSAAIIRSRYCSGCKSDHSFSAEGYELG